MKRVLSLIISIAMVASLMTGLVITANAAETFINGDFIFKILDTPNTVSIKKEGTLSGDIIIPATVTNSGTTYTVTDIGNDAFYQCTGMTSVTIPSGVTNIGNTAFQGCSSLASVTIPDGVTNIGDSAFNGCTSLTNITIPSGVTSIGSGAFMNCSALASVTIPGSVTSFGASAFRNTGLKSVIIPEGVTTISQNAFYDCKSLTNVTIPNSVTKIDMNAFFNCISLTDVTIPKNVTTIDISAFNNCTGLTNITVLAENPPTLGTNAFYQCNISSIYVPAGKEEAYKNAAGWSEFAAKIFSGSGITLENKPIELCYASYGATSITTGTNTVTVDKIKTNTNITINIPSGKTLIVSQTDSPAINISGSSHNLTITGAGTLEAISKKAGSGPQAIVATGDININGVKVKITVEGTDSGYGIRSGGDTTISSGATIIVNASNGKAIYANGNVNIDNSTVNATTSGSSNQVIYSQSGNIEITNESYVSATSVNSNAYCANAGGINIENNSTVNGISYQDHTFYALKDINISNSNVYSVCTANDAIFAKGDINIVDSTVTADSAKCGIEANLKPINISLNSSISAKGNVAAFAGKLGIVVDGVTMTDTNYEDYFYGENGQDIFFGLVNSLQAITSTDWVCFGNGGNYDFEDDESEDIRDIDVTIGNGTTTVPVSYKSIVLNDKKYVETEVMQSNNLFVPIDLSSAPKNIDGIFLNNDIYKYIANAGKGLELKTRFAKADVYTEEVGNNPVSLNLSDVSEIAGECATGIQKKAMNTKEVLAEVRYSFVSNGKPVDANAKIYVPVEQEAKVFYLFNESKIGIVPCENKDGYCIFDRYFDGTYIICAK